MLSDKLMHRLVGAACVVVGFTAGCVGGEPLVGVEVGLLAAAILAKAKENYDLKHPDKHSYDGWDAMATVEGAVATHVLLVLVPLVTYSL